MTRITFFVGLLIIVIAGAEATQSLFSIELTAGAAAVVEEGMTAVLHVKVSNATAAECALMTLWPF